MLSKYMEVHFNGMDKEFSKMDPDIDKNLFLQILLNIYLNEKKLYNAKHAMPQDLYFDQNCL